MTKLPGSLQEIADVIGLAAAIKLAEQKGGQQVFIPNKLSETHWLIGLMGEDKARDLVAYFTHETGTHILIPKAEVLRRAKKAEMVAALLAEGHSANTIAERTQLTRRQIFRKKSQLRASTKLPDLFDFDGK